MQIFLNGILMGEKKKKKGEETVEKWIIHQSMNSNNSIYDMRSRVKRYERWERPFLSITLFMTIYANSHKKKKKKMLESSYFFPLKSSSIFYAREFIDVSSSA